MENCNNKDDKLSSICSDRRIKRAYRYNSNCSQVSRLYALNLLSTAYSEFSGTQNVKYLATCAKQEMINFSCTPVDRMIRDIIVYHGLSIATRTAIFIRFSFIGPGRKCLTPVYGSVGFPRLGHLGTGLPTLLPIVRSKPK